MKITKKKSIFRFLYFFAEMISKLDTSDEIDVDDAVQASAPLYRSVLCSVQLYSQWCSFRTNSQSVGSIYNFTVVGVYYVQFCTMYFVNKPLYTTLKKFINIVKIITKLV